MSISDRIERAARVILDACQARRARYPMMESVSVEAARECAQALDRAGLLAPAPLTEEWGVRWDDHDIWGDMYNSRDEAETGAGDEGAPVHRYVTAWEPADGIDRSEGGKATADG